MPSSQLPLRLRRQVAFDLLRQERSYSPEVRLVYLVGKWFRREGFFAGGGLYVRCQVIFDEPGHGGQNAGNYAHPDASVGLAALDKAGRAQVQVGRFAERSLDP